MRSPFEDVDTAAVIEPFSTEHILEIVSPYLRQVLPMASPEGRTLWKAMRRRTLISTLRLGLKQLVSLRRVRTQEETEQVYANSYAEDFEAIEAFDAQLEPTGNGNPFRLGGGTLLWLPPNGLFAVYLATLAEIIARLKPSTVCEVGFGSGKNLMYLAPHFPEVSFCGYELTESGVALARRLQGGKCLPPNLARLVGRTDAEAMAAIRRINFFQGNVRDLPARDKSFDLTFTVLALEQMWPILPQALAEIRRVTHRHVVFLEAFREANDWLGYFNLVVRNYFRAKTSRIHAAGFRPVAFLRHLPSKRTHSAAVLVAEVMPERPARVGGA